MRDLLTDVVDGNEWAFRQFYYDHFDRLYRFACSYLEVAEEAEEIVSDVFLNIWLKREQLSNIQNINTYLYTAVRNAALNCLKKKNSVGNGLKDQYLHIKTDTATLLPDDILISKENELAMEKAVNHLPPACKMIFRLVREDGLKYREVADILDISINTVNVQMAIAVKKLSKSIRLERRLNIL
jgi:RNA polymerase sigma-70 factor (ECF subfamily)